MNTQQECPGNGNLSWQKPAVIRLCYESEASGLPCFNGSDEADDCRSGPSALIWCGGGSEAVYT